MSGGIRGAGFPILSIPPTVEVLESEAAKRSKIAGTYRRMSMTWAVILSIWMLVLGGVTLYAALTVTGSIEKRFNIER